MSDHQPYVDAVRAAVQDREVPITAATVTVVEGRREATLRIDPEATETVFADATHVDLHWDEERGWRYIAHYEPHTGRGDTAVYLGMGVLATPSEVGNWIATVLINPGLIVSYGDDDIDPPRSTSDDDPQFEAALTRYATAAG